MNMPVVQVVHVVAMDHRVVAAARPVRVAVVFGGTVLDRGRHIGLPGIQSCSVANVSMSNRGTDRVRVKIAIGAGSKGFGRCSAHLFQVHRRVRQYREQQQERQEPDGPGDDGELIVRQHLTDMSFAAGRA